MTPSSWHGVTSVVMGNCGVGIAPCRPATREIAMRDLVNVEAIPFEVLNAGITWDWETLPAVHGRGREGAAGAQPRLHRAAHAVPPLRDGRGLDGAGGDGRGDGADRALLGEAIDAGAFGFSSTMLNQHIGFGGRPLACRNASRDELRAYCNVLRSAARARSSSR